MSASSGKRAPIPKKGSGLQLKDGNMPVLFSNRLGCHGKLPINGQTSKRVYSSSGKAIEGSSTRTSSTKITLRKATSKVSTSSSQVLEPNVSELSSAETVQAEFQSQSNNSPSRKIRMGEVVLVGSSSATSSGLEAPINGQTSKRVHSSSGKAIVGISTKTSSTKITLRKATSKVSTSSSQVEPDVSELSSAETVQAEFQSQSSNSPSIKIRMGEVVGSSSATSSSRPHRVSKQRSGQSNQENLSGLSASLTSKSSSSCRDTIDNNTIMDSLRSASPLYTNLNRNKDVAQKQNPSAIETKIPLRGKMVSRPKTVGGRGSVTAPANGISISDSRHQQPWSKSNSNNRANTIPSRTPVPRPSSRSNNSCTSRPILRESSSRTDWSSPSIGREVPWAVENLGQHRERLHQEQSFQGGMDIYDQYRDMRLDIDHMSYEDLLALEERIGNVSTGIEEENMWKYLSRRIYDHTSPSSENHSDIQCSICQEEFVNEDDEVGSLSCKHSYHLSCIDEWLRRMKWCPNCKVEAAPIDSSSSK